MKFSMIFKLTITAFAMSISTIATAAPVCTNAAPAKWMTPAQMKAKIAKMPYRNIKAFKKSGSCYEIYAYTKSGKRAEVYFNPVTGAVVQSKID
jgi:hypothetical protein